VREYGSVSIPQAAFIAALRMGRSELLRARRGCGTRRDRQRGALAQPGAGSVGDCSRKRPTLPSRDANHLPQEAFIAALPMGEG
jgi:hypothetical protein